MPHPRSVAWTGIALGALASFAGCLTDGQSGDPGASFASGTGVHSPHGAGYVTGTSPGGAGRSGATDGGAGASDSDASTDAKTPAAACVVGATATFSLAWSLEDATGAEVTCDAVGGRTVDIDVVNVATGAEAAATFPCAALAATTCAMPAGAYSISMKLRDASGATLSAIFAPTLFLVAGQDTAVASLPLQVGGGDATKGRGFALTWSIDKQSTGAIESCAEAGAATVRLLAGTTTFDLACADGKGRTTAVAAGSYPVTFDLLDASGAKLSETQTMTVPVSAGQLVFLGDVPFDVN